VFARECRKYPECSSGVGTDDSLIFTRDIGTQEIYSLSINWP
jgi:hypothetical protein